MSSKLLVLLIFFAAVALRPCYGLQVTPNSPCSSVCIDSSDLDTSDPNSSNTKGSDIVCHDDDYSKGKGRKFKECMTCLQDSTFEQGSERDQDWFLYNLRFAFGYCVFGLHNATGIESSPCVIDFACGHLKESMEKNTTPQAAKQGSGGFDYCAANSSAILGETYDDCLQCMQTESEGFYLSNFLVALRAGCEQKPAASIAVGLNETVFSQTTVEIVSPTPSASPGSKGLQLSIPVIVAIAIGSLVVLLLGSGCIYMQYRRRKNRAARARRVRASPLEFRCQTHVTPHSAAFPPYCRDDDDERDDRFLDEKPYASPAVALGSNPVSPQEASALTSRSNKPAHITTSLLPEPPAVHPSPKMYSPYDFKTPTSTTSTRSNAPFLSHQGFSSPAMSSPSTAYGRPSPQVGQVGFTRAPGQPSPAWGQGQASLPSPSRKGFSGAGTPVETRIQTSFDPPPRS